MEGDDLDDRLRPARRIAAPIRSLAHRFAYMGLVAGAFALVLLGKGDIALMERLRIQVMDAIAPILDVMSKPTATVSNAITEFEAMVDMRAENDRLRQANGRLMRWQMAARRLDAENTALRGLLNYRPPAEAKAITARVIADTGGAFAHSLILNAGIREGVKKGQAVIDGVGLVGRVIAAGARSARVLLITDLNSRIPVLVDASNTRAILAGDNTNRPRLIHLPQGAVVSPGDRIVTSGHGGILMPHLPIGIVSSVTDDAISIELFVDRNRLEYVRAVEFSPGPVQRLSQDPGTKGTAASP